MTITAEGQTSNFVLDTKAPTWDADVIISNITSIGFQADWSAPAVDDNFDTYILLISPIFKDGSVGDALLWNKTEDSALGTISTLTTTVNKAQVAEAWNVDFYVTDDFKWTRFLVKKTIECALGKPSNLRVEAYSVT